MPGFRSFPKQPKATDDEEEQPFLPKNPPASMEAIDRKRSFLKHSKPTDYKRKPPRHPSTVEKYGIASGALTVIGFFGNFCQTLVKTCFGGGQPSTAIYTGINPGVGANNKGIIIGGVAASPGELEALLREANRSLESRRADEGRSWREGVDMAASHAAASKTAATASKTAAAPLGETRPTSKSASV